MKQLNKILFAVLLLLSFASNAQDENNPWAITFGANAVDTRTSASNRPGHFGDHFSKFFKVNESWNILTSVSYLNVSRYVGDNFSFGVSDRGASIRIPIGAVEKGWKGWLEDRRPNSAADPYKVAARIIKTVKTAKV